MKKVMKRVITACLAFAMILALVTPASVEAATKNESLTLYKGETYTWYLTGVKSLSSASSTKKAVATVKANKSKKQYTISAKKAGNFGCNYKRERLLRTYAVFKDKSNGCGAEV